MSATDTLGLYVSVPFCRSKCSFCNFASNVYAASHHGRYVERVCEELRDARRKAEIIGAHLPQQVDTIYLGGGTPSVLEPDLLHQLFATIRSQFSVTPEAEITMECAPAQIDVAVLAAMVECGVNRVSLGVQSFVDREAATTGRLHNRAITLADIARLRAAGIDRINLDLIAGLPHQTLDSWLESLEVLIGTSVQHASVYMLEVDDESRLGKELLQGGARYHAGAVPKDDTIAAMFEIATEHLSSAGIEQYEISNYATPGQESKHNLKYWTREPYLGIGLDAHSMLRRQQGIAGEGRSIRFGYTDDLDAFIGDGSWQNLDRLAAHSEHEEAWFLGLRLNAGISLNELVAGHGEREVARFLPTLVMLEKDGLVVRDDDRIALTGRGKLLSNEVFAQILEVGEEELCPVN
jgi:oxygen-independent coproporphyrinogen-3 oxidase